MLKKIVLFSLLFLAFFNNSQGATLMFQDMSGQNISLESLRGKWVIINYWASWCQPCVEEISELNRFYKKNKDRVALFAVNYDRVSVAQQMALIRKFKIRYPSLQKDPAWALGLSDIRGVPATFILNPQGKLSKMLYGSQTFQSLKRAVFD